MIRVRVLFSCLICVALLAATVHAAEAVSKQQKLVQLRQRAFLADLSIGVPDFNEVTELIVRQVAPKDPDWNPLNPKWQKLAGIVRRDIQADIADKLEGIKAAAYASWDKALDDHLSESEVDSLLNLYRSNEGRRYSAFQNQIAAVAAAGLIEIGKETVSGLTRDSATVPDPSQEKLAARQRLLNMSMTNLIMERQYERDKNHKDRSEYSSENARDQYAFRNFTTALSQGDKLDLLQEQYASEIVGFEKLSHSALMSKFADANLPLLGITRTSMASSVPVIEDFIKKHLIAWRQVYDSNGIGSP